MAQATARTFGPGRAVAGLEFERYFTKDGVDPFDEVDWELRSALIANEKGELVFEQRDVEFPKTWSQQATNIVVSKYFRGQIGTPERERSVKQLIGRVVDTITAWAREEEYFASEDDLQAFSDDLKHLLVYQKGSFNSPVWFNCGFEKAPQCSACFINAVQDTMESILTLAKISTADVNPNPASTIASAASVARPLPQASGASTKPKARRSAPRVSKPIEPQTSRLPLEGVIASLRSRPEALPSRAA